MRRSRSDTAETRARIVSVASRVLLERGLEKVGMREVMEAADLTAGGFYRHFPSKDALIAEAIRAAFDRLFRMFAEVTEGKTPEQSLGRVVTLYLQQARELDRGIVPFLCPLAQLGSELGNASPAVRAVAFEGRERLTGLIAGYVSALREEDASSAAEMVVNTLVGAVLSAKLAPNAEAARRILEEAKRAILDKNGIR